LIHLGAQVERASGTVTAAAENAIGRALRCRAQNARFGCVPDRCSAVVKKRPYRAGRMRDWRSANRFASERFQALGAAVRVGGDIKIFARAEGGGDQHGGKFGPTFSVLQR
jgi:hypothetical protein